MTATESKPVGPIVDGLAFALTPLSPEESERRRLAELSATRKAQQDINAILDAANIPRRQRGTQARQAKGWSDALEKLVQCSTTGFLMALTGIRGNGKTQLAVELIRHNAGQGRRARFCSAMEFFMEIKAGYRNESKAEKDIIGDFCRPSLLVVDEIGQRSDSEWENRLLYEMVNRRYNDMKDTLLISNQEEAQLKAALGPSIVSRMNETGGLMPCDWPSFRV